MPTGYTAEVLDGKVTTAKEFAKLCSKAFVFYQRDDAIDAPLRMPSRNIDTYYAEDLAKSIEELREWDNSTEEQKYAQWSEYATRQEESAAKAKAEAKKNYTILNSLLQEVKAIDVPETHKNFKNFMIDQIKDTMKYDGNFDERWYRVVPYVEWVTSQRGEILRRMERSAEGLKKAEDNHRTSVEWVSTLARIYDLEVKD